MILSEKFHISHPQGLKVNAGNVFNPRVVIGKCNLTIASGLFTQLFFLLCMATGRITGGCLGGGGLKLQID